MTGHEPIIKMRVNGMVPTIVFLGDFQDPAAKDWNKPGEKYGQKWAPDHATVCIGPDEKVNTLDLRFLKGLRVSISATTEDRAKALFQRSINAGAKTVAAGHIIFEGPFERISTGWNDIYHEGT